MRMHTEAIETAFNAELLFMLVCSQVQYLGALSDRLVLLQAAKVKRALFLPINNRQIISC